MMLFDLLKVTLLGTIWCWAQLANGATPAPETFPYSQRVVPYAVRGTTVLGDLSYVGIAGAAVGAPDSMVGALDNPAGLALTLTRPGLLLNSQRYSDDHIQSEAQSLESQNVLMSWSPYPWGFGASIWTPYTEGGRYISPKDGQSYRASIRMTEYLFSMSRAFWKGHIALGLSAGVASLSRDWEKSSSFVSEGSDSYAPSLSVGFLAQLRHRVVFGASASAPIVFKAIQRTSAYMDGFHQSAYAPPQYRFGVGWIPNRLFSISAALYFLGPFRENALLSDQTQRMKTSWIPQIRVGARYRWLEIQNLSSEIYVGTYTEVARLQGGTYRAHGTGGVEINPWIVRLGLGFDLAHGYRNLFASFGVDFPQLLVKLGLVDPFWRPKPVGVFSSPAKLSEEGLPPGLSSNRIQKLRTRINLLKEGKNIPERAKDSIKNLPHTLLDAGGEVLELLEKIPQSLLPESSEESEELQELEPDL